MVIPEGYKMTEVGIIPEDWDVVSLSQIYTITSSKRVFQSEWKTSGIPFYRAREIALMSEGKTAPKALYISVEMFNSYVRQYGGIKENDILITGVGTLGKVYVVKASDRFYFKDGNIIWLKWKGASCSIFIKQLYDTPYLQRQVHNNADGSTVGTYTITNAKKTIIPFPPLAEQQRIAEVLLDMDRLIIFLENLIAKKKNIKQGAMQELLTGKRRLHGFDGEWVTLNLVKNSKVKARIGWQGLKKSEYLDSGYAYLVTGTDFHNGVISWQTCHFVEKERYDIDRNIQIKNDDLLITKDGSLGKIAIVKGLEYPATLNSGIFVVRPLNKAYVSAFVYYILSSFVFRAYLDKLSAGSTIVHLYQKDLYRFEFMVPPTEKEQIAIAELLSDMDNEIEELEKKLAKYRNIKQGMMSELLSGHIRLTEKEGA